MKEEIRVLISEEDLYAHIRELADRINRDYEGKELHLLCTLKGAVFFTCELAKHLTVPVKFTFVKCSSYGGSTTSSGKVHLDLDLDEDIRGKDVLVVEDIIDTGNTLSFLIDILGARDPASLKLCTMLDKPSRRRVKGLVPDYNCFTIDDLFVVGFGLDYDQKYRNLPYIGVVSFVEE